MVRPLSQLRNDVKNRIIAVILCAGEGKRLRKTIKNIPKPLIQINSLGNKSILHHNIDLLLKMGVYKIAIVKGHLGEKIDEFLEHLVIENLNLQEKLILIDSLEQYKLGPLYSFLSITRDKNIFQDKYVYLIIPGDTIFQYDLLNEIFSVFHEKIKGNLEYPLIFYRKIEVISLKQKTQSERISLIDLEETGSKKFLKTIKQEAFQNLSNSEVIDQIIPIFLFSYHFIHDIIDIEKQLSVTTIKGILNHLIKRGSKIGAIEIDKDYDFYDIDTKLDLFEIQKF
ncbi:MAG: hypothetical protein EU532_03290 [Promethearchaeota archaeon]|nr:MAG: hypothetical protein EU532_03290 [Candidatus Lokiarchaeota archaeon]